MRLALLPLLVLAAASARATDLLASNYFGDNLMRLGLDGSSKGTYGTGQLDGPLGVSRGPDGKLYVASEVNHSVQRYDANTGAYLDTFATGLAGPTGVAFAPDGSVLVGNFDDDSVSRYSASGAYLGRIVPSGMAGLNGPDVGLIVHDGVLYVPSFYSNAVLKFDATTGAGLGSITGGGLTQPRTILFRDDRIWVASDDGNRVLRYRMDGTFADTFVPAGDHGLSGVSGMAFADGDLFVASWRTSRIFRYNGTTGAYLGALPATGLNGPTFLMAVPEPTTVVGTGAGLALLARRRRR